MNSCEDIPHKNISLAIIQCIGKFRNSSIYEDFQVNIEGETIRCHLFILASCSEFFSSLIRSNMKEKQEMKVDLQNIPMKIFQLILKTLYTGCELLTKDNVLEVWSAVHQLQIHFLVQHCEDFILENISLETLETYKKHAEFLQSERVSEGIFKYMLENFMILRSTEAFLRLQFEDLLRLIESDSLVVTSEDLVLQSVYEWINFGESFFVTVKNEADSTLKTSSKDTSLTEIIVHSSKYDDSGKNIEAIDVSSEIVSELKEATEESQSNDVSNNSLTQTKSISSLSQEDGAPSAPSQCQGNPRSVYLLPLLKATRYFLLSRHCVLNLYRNKLTQSSAHVKEFFFETYFESSCPLSGFWSPAALHRDCSSFEHLGVVCIAKNTLAAFSFQKDKWLCCSSNKSLTNCTLLVHNSVLYACLNYNTDSELFAFQNSKWVSVLAIETVTKLIISHDIFIYIINLQHSIISSTEQDSTVIQFNPLLPSSHSEIKQAIGNPDYAISFYPKILLFEKVPRKESTATLVSAWDTDSNALSNVIELDFSAEGMVSFRDEKCTYILDDSGRLYAMNQLETIQFTFLNRLWSLRSELKGAVLFKGVLFLCGMFPDDNDYQKNVFPSLKLLTAEFQDFISNFVPCTFVKSHLF
ncbi:uncharacterized protein LOC106050455 [Biomphalaria glabrata]|uniref:Uncharacterized protein LOC106050455 n=1 Tax=Biomphalaria glabrata TaxID=6526 RepID=A0A9U8DTT8_BIOGL|nr:uncharacterized protein LOC106050455 [Biomphalaria glabrata]